MVRTKSTRQPWIRVHDLAQRSDAGDRPAALAAALGVSRQRVNTLLRRHRERVCPICSPPQPPLPLTRSTLLTWESRPTFLAAGLSKRAFGALYRTVFTGQLVGAVISNPDLLQAQHNIGPVLAAEIQRVLSSITEAA